MALDLKLILDTFNKRFDEFDERMDRRFAALFPAAAASTAPPSVSAHAASVVPATAPVPAVTTSVAPAPSTPPTSTTAASSPSTSAASTTSSTPIDPVARGAKEAVDFNSPLRCSTVCRSADARELVPVSTAAATMVTFSDTVSTELAGPNFSTCGEFIDGGLGVARPRRAPPRKPRPRRPRRAPPRLPRLRRPRRGRLRMLRLRQPWRAPPRPPRPRRPQRAPQRVPRPRRPRQVFPHPIRLLRRRPQRAHVIIAEDNTTNAMLTRCSAFVPTLQSSTALAAPCAEEAISLKRPIRCSTICPSHDIDGLLSVPTATPSPWYVSSQQHISRVLPVPVVLWKCLMRSGRLAAVPILDGICLLHFGVMSASILSKLKLVHHGRFIHISCVRPDYMSSQQDINSKMRAILIDFSDVPLIMGFGKVACQIAVPMHDIQLRPIPWPSFSCHMVVVLVLLEKFLSKLLCYSVNEFCQKNIIIFEMHLSSGPSFWKYFAGVHWLHLPSIVLVDSATEAQAWGCCQMNWPVNIEIFHLQPFFRYYTSASSSGIALLHLATEVHGGFGVLEGIISHCLVMSGLLSAIMMGIEFLPPPKQHNILPSKIIQLYFSFWPSLSQGEATVLQVFDMSLIHFRKVYYSWSVLMEIAVTKRICSWLIAEYVFRLLADSLVVTWTQIVTISMSLQVHSTVFWLSSNGPIFRLAHLFPPAVSDRQEVLQCLVFLVQQQQLGDQRAMLQCLVMLVQQQQFSVGPQASIILQTFGGGSKLWQHFQLYYILMMLEHLFKGESLLPPWPPPVQNWKAVGQTTFF